MTDILLAEDTDEVRVALARALRMAGFTVEAVEDGALAWKKIREKAYDLIISDNRMPYILGHQLIGMVRGSQLNAKTPFILCTADVPQSIAENVEKLGGVVYVKSSSTPLVQIVKKLLTK